MKKISCCICNSSDLEDVSYSQDLRFPFSSAYEFLISRCKKCGLLFINPQPDSSELLNHYPSEDYFSLNKKETKQSQNSFIKQIIKQYFLPSKKLRVIDALSEQMVGREGQLLDIGCGTGRFLEALRSNFPNWNLYGLEPNKSAAAFARRKGLQVTTGFIEDSNFQDGSIDLILLHHVLEHIEHPLFFLEKCSALLKKGGYIIIAVPNHNSPLARIFGKHWYHMDIPRHLFFFTPTTLQNLIKKAGFSVVRLETEPLRGSFINSLKYKMRIKPKKKNTSRNLSPWVHVYSLIKKYNDVIGGIICKFFKVGGGMVIVVRKN